VKAVNEIGESEPSNQVVIHMGVEPSQIQTLVWEDSTTTSVTVRWMPPQWNGGISLTKFTVYYDIGQTGTFDT